MSMEGKDFWRRKDEGRFFATKVSAESKMILKVKLLTEADEDIIIGIRFQDSLDEDPTNVLFFINIKDV